MVKLLIFLITCFSSAYAQKTYKNINNLDKKNFFEKYLLHPNRTYKKSEAPADFNVTYYRCEWKTDPAVRYIRGTVTSYFIITSSENSIVYDLSDSLQVDSVKERNNSLSFSHQNNILKINFNEAKPAGTLDSVNIYYKGVPPSTGFGAFVNSSHNGVPIMWTLSEPYGSSDWWPCKNGLNDKADSIDVYITAPVQYKAVSNGLRESEITLGNNKITHWKHRYPIASYLVCMAITNYVEFNNYIPIENTNLLMQTFCYPEDISLFKSNTPMVLSALQYFSKIFGPYPFIKEKYGQVQFGWGGGEEHQTSTFIVRPDESLMSHELGHHWFGNKITCASWQDIWLNEGFATHLASMYMENKYPLTVISTRKKEIENITSIPDGSVFVTDTTNVSRIFDFRLTYTKGSHLLYMLRWILGDSVFFKGMRSYFDDPSISFGFARTTDFQRNLEKVSGLDLSYFFNDWLYGQGYPSYHVTWTPIGNDYVRIKIDQTASDPSVKFFALPVALQFKNSNQQKTIVIDNKINGEVFIRKIGFMADTLIIDPEYWLITKNNTSEQVVANGKNIIQVFPTPFINCFSIYIHNLMSPVAHLQIYDSGGKLMMRKDLEVSGSLFFEVNAQAFARGIYFIKIQTDNGFKFVKKILRQ
jgi:aminopeptidase N